MKNELFTCDVCKRTIEDVDISLHARRLARGVFFENEANCRNGTKTMNTEFETKVLTALQRIENRLMSPAANHAAPQQTNLRSFDPMAPFNDPVIRKDPPRWNGDSCVGLAMSACPADFLNEYASFKEWCVKQDEMTGKVAKNGKPAAMYSKMDAERARYWAANAKPEGDVEEEIPF